MAKRRGPAGDEPEPDPSNVDAGAANRGWADDGLEDKETRGEKKRKAEQLERLGESLVDLAAYKLARVPMPDDLAAAVHEARRLKEGNARGGYRRQVQFIGRIMRTLDARPLADAIEHLNTEDAPSSAAFLAAERWRDRLIAGDDADLDVLLQDKPDADRTHLRQVIRQAKKEAKENKPPHAARALFRALRLLFLG